MAGRDTVLAVLELDADPNKLVERAAWVADAFGCNVQLLLFEPEPALVSNLFSFSTDIDSLRHDIRQALEKIVEDYADKIRASGIEVETSVLQARPLGDHILTIAEAVNPRVVLKSTRTHSVAERSVLVDTDWQLLRTCNYPLWFVKATEIAKAPVIVAAVDPCHSHDKPAALDAEIVAAAKAAADAAGGELHLVHAYETLTDIGAAATWAVTSAKLSVDEIDSRMKMEHRTALDELAKANEIATERTHLVPARASHILPAFAREKNASIFVLGALSRWGLNKLIVGSTAERIIDDLACDILIVRLGEYQLDD